ncbi:MAG: hypothetical protein ACRC1Z_15770 [Waterburya sp.]
MDGATKFDYSPPLNFRPLALSTTAKGVWAHPPIGIFLLKYLALSLASTLSILQKILGDLLHIFP